MLWGLNNGSPDLTPDARGSPTRRSAVSYQGGKVGNPRSGKPNLIGPINTGQTTGGPNCIHADRLTTAVRSYWMALL